MNNQCEIIRDLLPLYADGVCSAASRNLVEQHIQDCSACAEVLKLISDELPVTETAAEVDGAKAASKAWKKRKLRYVLLGLLIAAVLCGSLYGLTSPNIVPVDEAYLEVGDVYRMERGAVYVELTVTDGKKHNFIKYEMVDGAFYITPMQPVITSKEHPDYAQRKNTHEHVVGHVDCTAVYVGWGDDAILVWEEGMELPKAPADIETEFSHRS